MTVGYYSNRILLWPEVTSGMEAANCTDNSTFVFQTGNSKNKFTMSDKFFGISKQQYNFLNKNVTYDKLFIPVMSKELCFIQF